MSKERSKQQIYEDLRKISDERKVNPDLDKVTSSKDVMNKARPMVEQSGLKVADKAFGEVKKILESSEKTDKSIEKMNPNNKKKPSMKDQMVSALLLMTPQLLGTAVGAAMGEDVAGYEGAIAGQKVGEGIIDREKARIIEEQKMQENAQESMTDAQKVRAWTNIGQHGMDKARLDLRERERERYGKQFEKTHEYKEKQYGTASGKQVEQLSVIDQTMGMADRMAELTEKVNTGIFANFGQGLLEMFDAAPEEYTQLKTNVINTLASVTKATTGAQATDAERKWLEDSVPSMKDDDNTFQIKVKELQRKLKMLKDRNLKTMKLLQGKNIPKEYEIGEASNFEFNEKATKATLKPISEMSREEKLKELGL